MAVLLRAVRDSLTDPEAVTWLRGLGDDLAHAWAGRPGCCETSIRSGSIGGCCHRGVTAGSFRGVRRRGRERAGVQRACNDVALLQRVGALANGSGGRFGGWDGIFRGFLAAQAVFGLTLQRVATDFEV